MISGTVEQPPGTPTWDLVCVGAAWSPDLRRDSRPREPTWRLRLSGGLCDRAV